MRYKRYTNPKAKELEYIKRLTNCRLLMVKPIKRGQAKNNWLANVLKENLWITVVSDSQAKAID